MPEVIKQLGLSAKAVGAMVVALLTAAHQAMQDDDTPGRIVAWEWPTILAAGVLVAAAVWVAPMNPVQRYAKLYAGAIVIGLAQLGVAFRDGEGVSSSELVALAIAVFMALGVVYVVPNAKRSAVLQP